MSSSDGLLAACIRASAKRPGFVIAIVVGAVFVGVQALRATPIDALPDLTANQVIVTGTWMGRSPTLVEDQVTTPLSAALLGLRGVAAVRGQSMPGMSFVYVVFDDDVSRELARSEVSQRLATMTASLPPDAAVRLGPDASGVGWIYQYALVDRTGRQSLEELRLIHEVTIKPALQSVRGVAEIATIGGSDRTFEVTLLPEQLRKYQLGAMDVARGIAAANMEVGAGAVDMGGTEHYVRGRGRLRAPSDIAEVIVGGGNATAIRVKDVARVATGTAARRGAGDLDGRGETVLESSSCETEKTPARSSEPSKRAFATWPGPFPARPSSRCTTARL